MANELVSMHPPLFSLWLSLVHFTTGTTYEQDVVTHLWFWISKHYFACMPPCLSLPLSCVPCLSLSPLFLSISLSPFLFLSLPLPPYPSLHCKKCGVISTQTVCEKHTQVFHNPRVEWIGVISTQTLCEKHSLMFHNLCVELITLSLRWIIHAWVVNITLQATRPIAAILYPFVYVRAYLCLSKAIQQLLRSVKTARKPPLRVQESSLTLCGPWHWHPVARRSRLYPVFMTLTYGKTAFYAVLPHLC